MNYVGHFEKVSFKQFFTATKEILPVDVAEEQAVREMYDLVKIPTRATKRAAGYDFVSPFSFTLPPQESVKLPTCIRVIPEDGWCLGILPRSGLGVKYRLQLANTMGVIDGDYCESENEGHIFIKLTNDSKEGKNIAIRAGDRFAQGIFLQYGITHDDSVTTERNGGFGSTGT